MGAREKRVTARDGEKRGRMRSGRGPRECEGRIEGDGAWSGGKSARRGAGRARR